MARPRFLTQEQEQEIRGNYRPKDSVSDLARYYGVCYNTILNILGDIYVSTKTGIKPKKKVEKKKAEEQPSTADRKITEAISFREHFEKKFEEIRVGQEVHYRNKSATVIQKTSCLVVLKVHRKNFDEIRSLNKVDIAKGLIA